MNFFVTYLLLEITARLAKKEAKTIRSILASAVGGAYSLVILISLPRLVSLGLKVLAAAVILLCAFSFGRVIGFAKTYLIFLFVNFVFLGVIVGLCYLIKPERIAVSNETVYFNLDAKGLLLCAGAAWALSCLVVRLYNKRAAAGEIYTLTIQKGGQSVTLFALSDNGNRLREPFSDYPVIVADKNQVLPLLPADGIRLVPADTVNKSSYLEAFRPDRVVIKNTRGEETVERAYVALADDLGDGSFSAVFNPEILSV